jgi:hypothetical protein
LRDDNENVMDTLWNGLVGLTQRGTSEELTKTIPAFELKVPPSPSSRPETARGMLSLLRRPLS